MILAVSGGVIGVAVLAMAYFTWSAYAAKVAAIEGDDDGNDGLETVQAKAQALSRKDVYPCPASVKAIEANAERLTAWRAEAERLAARGDRPVRKMTPAQFKTDLVADAKRLSALPGAVNGVLVKPDFAFGPFRSYIAEGKMPTDAELPEMQRRWSDVQLVVETLAACGVSELVNVDFKAAAEAKDDAPEKPAKKARKAPAKKGKAAEAAAARAPSAFSYVFTFATRAPAFVKAVNALGTDERFIVIDGFGFSRATDPVAVALGVGDKRADASRAASAGRGRRGRRGAAAAEEKKEEAEPKNGIVTDPALDAPFTVTMALTVYDFRTMEDEAKADDAKTEEAK